MKKGQIIAVLIFSFLGIVSFRSVDAATSNARQIFYFDNQNQLIGQSLLYCSNIAQHWGVASQGNRNIVTMAFACDTGAVSISYTPYTAPYIKSNFCSLYDSCADLQPYPLYQYATTEITSGFYSD